MGMVCWTGCGEVSELCPGSAVIFILGLLGLALALVLQHGTDCERLSRFDVWCQNLEYGVDHLNVWSTVIPPIDVLMVRVQLHIAVVY